MVWWPYISPVRTIKNARTLARNKATLDLIEKKESTDYYRRINETSSQLRQSQGFTHLNDPRTPEDRSDRQAIIDHLNHYEMVAIGIRDDLLDARLYRAWMEGAFVRDWNAASPWIQRERWKHEEDGSWSYRASILQNYENTACAWSKDAIRLGKEHSPPPAMAAGVSDEALPEPIDVITVGNDDLD